MSIFSLTSSFGAFKQALIEDQNIIITLSNYNENEVSFLSWTHLHTIQNYFITTNISWNLIQNVLTFGKHVICKNAKARKMFGQYIWLFPWRNETVKPIIVFVLADTYQSHLKFSDINTCIFIYTIGSGSFEWAWWLCMYWHGQVESTVLICIIKLLLSWNNIWKMINTETRKPCNIDYEITYRYNYE